MKTVDFSETIAACDLKVGKCRKLIGLRSDKSDLMAKKSKLRYFHRMKDKAIVNNY